MLYGNNLEIMTHPGQTGLTAAALTGSGAADQVRDGDDAAVGVEAGASRVGNKNKFINYNNL